MGYSKKTNQSTENGGAASGAAARRTFRVRPVVIAATAAIIAVVAFLVVGRGAGNGERETANGEKKVQRQRLARPAQPPQPPLTGKTAKAKAEKPAKPEPPPFVKRPGAMQLPNGKILTFPAPKEGEIRKVYANGRMYECDHLGNFKDVTKRKLFKTAFELNFLAFAQEGKPYIPVFLKGLDEEDVKRMLLKNYTPIGDETEEEWAELKAYDNMRCAALQYMEEGGSFDDFVMDFANYEKKSRETNAMCLREVMTLCKEGKIQEAKEMAEAATKLMEQKGLRPFKLPPHVKAAFESM